MKQHLVTLASAAVLLAACGQNDPDPMPAPRPDDDPPAAQSESTGDADTNDEVGADSATSPTEGSDQLDVESAMSGSAADGVWITQPNWTGFGPADSEAVFMLQCGEFGMIRMTRMVDVESTEPFRAAVSAGEATERGFWTVEDQQENPSAVFEAYAESPVFDAMKTADKIAVLAEGKPDLIVPGSDELTQQINSCQNQGTGTP